jgi:hypothetical protein
MFRSTWLHNLFGMARSCQDRRCQATQQQHSVRLMLEPLEDRITPSVATWQQTGPTWQQKIAIANAFAVQRAESNYLNQIINSFLVATGGQPSVLGQNGTGEALAALNQYLIAISKELSPTNFPNNPVSLLELQLQLQQQMAQSGTPTPTGVTVSP